MGNVTESVLTVDSMVPYLTSRVSTVSIDKPRQGSRISGLPAFLLCLQCDDYLNAVGRNLARCFIGISLEIQN